MYPSRAGNILASKVAAGSRSKRVVPLTLALVLLAGTGAAQVILRKPGQAPPLLRSQGQVQRPPGTIDPDGPYSLALRVYVTPADPKEALAPGQGVQLLVIDPIGRRFGRGAEGHAIFFEIADATYDVVVNPNPHAPVGPRGRAGVGITLRQPKEGKYELQVTGTARSEYDYVLQAFDRTGRQRWMHFGRRSTEPGASDRFEVTYSLSLDPPVWIAEIPDRAYLSATAWGETGGDQNNLPFQLLLTDPRGRRLGYEAPAGTQHREIPRGRYAEDGGQTVPAREIEIFQPLDGSNTLEVSGLGTGSYDGDIYYSNGTDVDTIHLGEAPTVAGTVHRYRLECARGSQPLCRLSGAFTAGGVLSFASPISASTRVGAAQPSFTIVVFYGAAIRPESFRATLNGTDIGSRFRPAPDAHQIVTLPLHPGKNELVLSVQDRTGSEMTPERLEFDVR